MPSYFGVNKSVDTIEVGVRPFDEPKEVCEKWGRIDRILLAELRGSPYETPGKGSF